jgi:hypothetical protein
MRVRDGELEKILRLLATELQARGQLPLEEGFIDASFTGRKKGGSQLAILSAAKARRFSRSALVTVFLSPSGDTRHTRILRANSRLMFATHAR